MLKWQKTYAKMLEYLLISKLMSQKNKKIELLSICMIGILCQLFKIYIWITKIKTKTLMINFQISKLMILLINKRNFLKTT